MAARLSLRMRVCSAYGYQKIKWVMKSILSCVDRLLAQTEADKARFTLLGVDAKLATVCGNIKYDTIPASASLAEQQRFQEALKGRFAFLAVSTHPGEEKQLLEAYKHIKQAIPNCLLLIAPRHPSRADDIVKLIKSQAFKAGRRSLGESIESSMEVYLIDTLGELNLFYMLCDCCFVGGSLVTHGGHNVLEPIALGKPVLTGPHTFNFKQVCDELVQEGGLLEVDSSSALSLAVIKLKQFKDYREKLILAANKVYQRNQGALAKQWDIIRQL